MGGKLAAYVRSKDDSIPDETLKALAQLPSRLDSRIIEMAEEDIKNGRPVDLGAIIEKVRAESPQRTEQKSVPDKGTRKQPAQKEKVSLRDRISSVFSNKWAKIGCGTLVGVVILILIFMALSNFGPSGFSPNTPAVEATQTPPTFSPEVTVDLKSVPFIGITQFMLILGLILVPILGTLDGRERFEVSDIVYAIVGFLVNYFVVWGPMLAFLTAFEWMSNPRTATAVVSLVMFVAILVKSLTGRRDTTNLGVYFACLAFGGAVFSNMGAMQIAFDVPTQPLYLLQDLPDAILAKLGPQIQYSMLVYSMFFLSIGCYLIDIFFPNDGETRWEAVITAVVVVGGFYLAGIWMGPAAALLVAVAAAVVLATIARRSGTGVTTGESALSKAVSRAFEYTAWDGVAVGVVITILLHLSGLT